MRGRPSGGLAGPWVSAAAVNTQPFSRGGHSARGAAGGRLSAGGQGVSRQRPQPASPSSFCPAGLGLFLAGSWPVLRVGEAQVHLRAAGRAAQAGGLRGSCGLPLPQPPPSALDQAPSHVLTPPLPLRREGHPRSRRFPQLLQSPVPRGVLPAQSHFWTVATAPSMEAFSESSAHEKNKIFWNRNPMANTFSS